MSTNLVLTVDDKQLALGVPVPTSSITVHKPADSAALAALTPAMGDFANQQDDGSWWIYDGTSWVNQWARWDDFRVPLETVRAGGVRPPGFEKVIDDGAGSTGVYAFHFDPTSEEEVFFSKQIPHDWAPETDWKPHIHWMPKDAGAGNVVWLLEYSFAEKNAVFPATTIARATVAAPGVALKHTYAAFPTIDMTGVTGMSGEFLCRLSREAGNVADTYASDAIGIEFDSHYLRLGNGSRQELVR